MTMSGSRISGDSNFGITAPGQEMGGQLDFLTGAIGALDVARLSVTV